MIDFLGAQPVPLYQVGRGSLGPWRHAGRGNWTRVVKRIAVPPGTKDAIMSVGLMGATGTMDIDGLTVKLIDIAAVATTNLVVNGDFEAAGDPLLRGAGTRKRMRGASFRALSPRPPSS